MQGGLISPTIFNVVVDIVIRTWLAMTVEDQRVSHDGLEVNFRRCLGFLYANDGIVGSRDADWMQHSMKVLAGLFQWYGLSANIAKSLTMTYQPSALRLGMSEEAKALKFTGVGHSYRMRIQRRIPCPECGFELTAGSMMAHRRRMHGTEPGIDWSRLTGSQTEHQPQVYFVRFPQSTKRCPCPFPGYPGSSRMHNGLHSYFNSQYWGYRIRILEKHPNPLPKCNRYGSQFPEGRLNTCHYVLKKCKQVKEKRLRRETLQCCFKASSFLFQINAETLKP